MKGWRKCRLCDLYVEPKVAILYGKRHRNGAQNRWLCRDCVSNVVKMAAQLDIVEFASQFDN